MACLFADFLGEFLMEGTAGRARFDALARLVWDLYAERSFDAAWDFRLRLKARLYQDDQEAVVWGAVGRGLHGPVQRRRGRRLPR
jgi:hypothetical protein